MSLFDRTRAFFCRLYNRWLRPLDSALEHARILSKAVTVAGVPVPDNIISAIRAAKTASQDGSITRDIRAAFYNGYAKLAEISYRLERTDATIDRNPFAGIVRRALLLLDSAAAAGIAVPDDITDAILAGQEACNGAAPPTADQQKAFYVAYTKLAKLAPTMAQPDAEEIEDSFADAVNDSELLLKFAAESGIEIAPDIAGPVLAARTALEAGLATDTVRAAFYSAYAKLAKPFGDATADTIRNCTSLRTRKTLAYNRVIALAVTALIATVSVCTFVTDKMSLRILDDITSTTNAAAVLRASLTATQASPTIDPKYAENPCSQLTNQPDPNERSVRSISDVEELSQFAATIRDLHSRALKLNWVLNLVLKDWECDPFGECSIPIGCIDECRKKWEEEIDPQLQINPAIVNYTAEVLCKIRTMQKIRSFASNVQADYAAVYGGFAAYALPIFYSLLGAYAFRLRLFSETIRKRTYHPSFVDSARLITAVIAGAISGLFNPAQGLSLSPLATAFLVGYGVELFFKFLDTLINAFGSGPSTGQRSAR